MTGSLNAGMEAQVDALLDMAALQAEPLHPDLAACETVNGLGMRMIAHPLVHDLLPINGYANRMYHQKRAMLAEAQAREDWHTCVFLHDRPYRCDALIDYVLGRDESTGLPFSMTTVGTEAREVVADVWTDSENIHQHVEDWLAITDGYVYGSPLLMGDQAAFDALPNPIEVWRGDCNDGGWSWTTQRKTAEFFCRRWDEDNDLLHGWVEKQYVFGYLTNRSESEVMVRREHVRDLTRTPYERTEP